MEISNQFETIRRQNYEQRLKNELDYIGTAFNNNIFANFQDINIEDRKLTIQLLLDHIGIIHTGIYETNQQKKDIIINEIEKYVYKKQWNKLTAFHKIVKINQFMTENYPDDPFHKSITDNLIKYIEDGKINTKKFVVYDPNLEKILSLPCLNIDKGKQTFNIKII